VLRERQRKKKFLLFYLFFDFNKKFCNWNSHCNNFYSLALPPILLLLCSTLILHLSKFQLSQLPKSHSSVCKSTLLTIAQNVLNRWLHTSRSGPQPPPAWLPVSLFPATKSFGVSRCSFGDRRFGLLACDNVSAGTNSSHRSAGLQRAARCRLCSSGTSANPQCKERQGTTWLEDAGYMFLWNVRELTLQRASRN
jgi:hypothetical protein